MQGGSSSGFQISTVYTVALQRLVLPKPPASLAHNISPAIAGAVNRSIPELASRTGLIFKSYTKVLSVSSTIALTSANMSSNVQSLSQSKKDRFLAVFPKIQAELLEFLEVNHLPEEAKQWFKRVCIPICKVLFTSSLLQNLDHNVPGGKLNRGVSVVDTVEILRGEQLSDQEYFEVALLGWGVELVSSYFTCLFLGLTVRLSSKRFSSSQMT
jgi:hypothetical protein